MTEVMLSIKPEWAEKILSGKKTLEVRKNKPSSVKPFKVYLYVTKEKLYFECFGANGKPLPQGKVVGEFFCDYAEYFSVPYPAYAHELPQWIIEKSCIGYYALHKYSIPSNGALYGWHVRNVKEYDEPLELNDFFSSKVETMKRPPQSWCYCKKK